MSGLVTVVVVTDTKGEADAAAQAMQKYIVDEVGAADAGAEVSVVTAERTDYGKHKVKLRMVGLDDDALNDDFNSADLAMSIWSEINDYCWMSIYAEASGSDVAKEKYDRSDYREMM